MDITYCMHVDCMDTECSRHPNKVPYGKAVSMADLNDGLCYTTKGAVVLDTINERDKLRAAICKGTQYTCHKCDEHCKSWCGNDGTCDYCGRIADAIEADFRKSGIRGS